MSKTVDGKFFLLSEEDAQRECMKQGVAHCNFYSYYFDYLTGDIIACVCPVTSVYFGIKNGNAKLFASGTINIFLAGRGIIPVTLESYCASETAAEIKEPETVINEKEEIKRCLRRALDLIERIGKS